MKWVHWAFSLVLMYALAVCSIALAETEVLAQPAVSGVLGTAMALYSWFKAHGAEVAVALLMLVGAAEIIVRLTPTKVDDGAVERIGKLLKSGLDKVGLPNRLKKPEVEKDE